MQLSNVIRFQAMLNYSGLGHPARPFDDRRIRTSCPACGVVQTLADAPVRLERGKTRYRCRNGCRDLATISAAYPGGPSEGFRLGEYQLWNACDVFIRVGLAQIRLPPADSLNPCPNTARADDARRYVTDE